jgi:hypothetical protein
MKKGLLIAFLISLSLNVLAQTDTASPSTTTTTVTSTTVTSTSTTTLPATAAVETTTSTTLPSNPPSTTDADQLASRLIPRGFSLGYRLQYFDYREPSPDVREHGPLNGIIGAFETPFGHDDKAFYRMEADYLFGRITYDGYYQNGDSLTASSDDHTFGLRFNIGSSVAQSSNFVVRLYTGGMFRYLYDYVQASGGYRREISQLSVPLGITYRKNLQRVTVSLTSEFDLLWAGIVKSHLSDVGPTHSDITNRQKNGFGGKISGTVEWPGKRTFIIEPSLQYWVIDDSDTDNDGTGNYLEPYNVTKMLNLNFIVRF